MQKKRCTFVLWKVGIIINHHSDVNGFFIHINIPWDSFFVLTHILYQCGLLSEIGYVTSGTFSPSLQEGIGLGVISGNFSEVTDIEVKIRSDKKKAKRSAYPFI